MERAVDEGREQTAIFTEFTNALEDEEPEAVAKWRKLVERWEADSKKNKNPYAIEKQSKRRLRLLARGIQC